MFRLLTICCVVLLQMDATLKRHRGKEVESAERRVKAKTGINQSQTEVVRQAGGSFLVNWEITCLFKYLYHGQNYNGVIQLILDYLVDRKYEGLISRISWDGGAWFYDSPSFLVERPDTPSQCISATAADGGVFTINTITPNLEIVLPFIPWQYRPLPSSLRFTIDDQRRQRQWEIELPLTTDREQFDQEMHYGGGKMVLFHGQQEYRAANRSWDSHVPAAILEVADYWLDISHAPEQRGSAVLAFQLDALFRSWTSSNAVAYHTRISECIVDYVVDRRYEALINWLRWGSVYCTPSKLLVQREDETHLRLVFNSKHQRSEQSLRIGYVAQWTPGNGNTEISFAVTTNEESWEEEGSHWALAVEDGMVVSADMISDGEGTPRDIDDDDPSEDPRCSWTADDFAVDAASRDDQL